MNAVINDDGQNLIKGALWYVRLPGHETISKMYIRDVTLHTVMFEEFPMAIHKPRYEIKTVKFLDEAY